MFDMKGKVAVVTGASSGLGADAARAYIEAGAAVALIARRKERLENLKAELIAKGGRAMAVQCDVSDEESVKAACDSIAGEYGKIDVLLNAAGVSPLGSVETLSEKDWDAAMNINLKGTFLMSKYVIPHMKKNHYGKIVNIASFNAGKADKFEPFFRHAYNASKAGVNGLTVAMAASYGQNGITVNSIGPGLFDTEMTHDDLIENEGFMSWFNSRNPMCRPGGKGDLNGTILYLSSDASNYVTGQFILVDGGASIVDIAGLDM
ncbi:SDR family oxidoreductase [bacterium 210820-DFI.6.37]|nr:SDR family oxidoreductase [bacterium 210820-DFI.6.37]